MLDAMNKPFQKNVLLDVASHPFMSLIVQPSNKVGGSADCPVGAASVAVKSGSSSVVTFALPPLPFSTQHAFDNEFCADEQVADPSLND